MSNSKRWYDQDPTVSLAVSILRNAKLDNQLAVADHVLIMGKDYGISPDMLKSDKLSLLPRRWYDFEEKVYYTLECLRLSSPEVQKKLAIEIINCLCNLDDSVAGDPV